MKIIKLKVQRDVCNSWCPLTIAREQEVLVLLLTTYTGAKEYASVLERGGDH